MSRRKRLPMVSRRNGLRATFYRSPSGVGTISFMPDATPPGSEQPSIRVVDESHDDLFTVAGLERHKAKQVTMLDRLIAEAKRRERGTS